MSRSRRAGLSRDEVRRQPLYARMLGLQYLAPSGFLCFVFLEGAVALGILLALAELVSWWGVLVLPATVAVMVKLNDVVAGALTKPQVRPTIVAPRSAPDAGLGLWDGADIAPDTGGLGAETVRLSRPLVAEATEPPADLGRFAGHVSHDGSPRFSLPGDGDLPGRSDTRPGWTPRAPTAPTGAGGPISASGPDVGEPGLLHDPRAVQQWTNHLEEQQQRARQSAARRYE
ncbi:hypothetical protein [Actinoplanes sp. NPDC051859]|uniref:hypothetical protein n=1 Tax=Actinoplanes sp. NPDC051859 TaxID=3363909 RepID=UPI0037AE6F9C